MSTDQKKYNERRKLKRQTDPNYRKQYNESRKEYYHRKMKDPEYRKKMRAKIRRFRAKQKRRG